jgi:hypothetical protein
MTASLDASVGGDQLPGRASRSGRGAEEAARDASVRKLLNAALEKTLGSLRGGGFFLTGGILFSEHIRACKTRP